jgi:hypothetical protein
MRNRSTSRQLCTVTHQLALSSLIRYFLNILFMAVYSCKKCGELNYLTPHAFWNISDFGAKC